MSPIQIVGPPEPLPCIKSPTFGRPLPPILETLAGGPTSSTIFGQYSYVVNRTLPMYLKEDNSVRELLYELRDVLAPDLNYFCHHLEEFVLIPLPAEIHGGVAAIKGPLGH